MKQIKFFKDRKALFWIFIIPLLVTLGVLLISLGFNPIIISSRSMEPNLNVGDVVFTRPVNDYLEINARQDGDIVVIKNKSVFLDNDVPADLYDHLDDDTPIIHRAIERRIVNGTLYFITKGDNNPYPDGCIRYEEIIDENFFTIEFNSSNPVLIPEQFISGKVIFVIPFIGYFKIYSNFISIYLLTLIVVISWFRVIRRRYNDEKQKIVIYPSNGKSKNS